MSHSLVAAFTLLFVFAPWTGLVWAILVHGDGLVVPIAISRTAELDVNRWMAPPAATITVWQG